MRVRTPMMATTVVAMLATTGCKKEVPVTLALTGGEVEETLTTDLEAREILVRHVDRGWISIPAEIGFRKEERLERGRPVVLAKAPIPQGTYDAIRIKYNAVLLSPEEAGVEEEPGVVRRPRMFPPRQPVSGEKRIDTFFCVDADNEDPIVLSLARAALREGEVQFQVESVPQC